MKAMVLAAGRGTRLLPLTDTCPKPMVPIAGRPLLEHVLLLLRGHGFAEIAINLHHLPEAVRDHFGDGGRWDVELTYSMETSLLGTAGAVRRLDWYFDEPFLIYYGDHLSNVDLSSLWRSHVAGSALGTIGLIEKPEAAASGIVELDSAGRVRRFVEKPRPEQIFAGFLINAGIYVCEPGIMDWINPSQMLDFGHDIFPLLLARQQVLMGHRLRGQLLGTDTPERYQEALDQVESGEFVLPSAVP